MSGEANDHESLSPSERMEAFREQMRLDNSGLNDYFEQLPYSPDQFQTEALTAFALGSSVLVSAPTGSGKTVVGEGAVFLVHREGRRSFYTTPIKALSNQKYREFCDRFGTSQVGLLTGDTSINPHAKIVVMTTEVLRNMIYADANLDDLGVVILDEIHYLADRVRGPVWEEVLIQLPLHVRIVALSATVSNVKEFGAWIAEVRGDCEIILSTRRPVPLYQHMMVKSRLYNLFAAEKVEARAAQKGESVAHGRINPTLIREVEESERHRPGSRPRTLQHGRQIPARFSRPRVVETLERRDLLPAIIFIFSRAGCDAAVDELSNAGFVLTTAAEQKEIRRATEEALLAIPIADHGILGLARWQSALEKGIAAHHAGLLPILKETVEELFAKGLIKVVYATETLALGINMPARTVVLESLEKWNGSEHVRLTPGEFTQLTGRAGRRGIDVEGHAVVLQRRVVQPEELAQLASRVSYPLKSAFFPNYNMVVNLLAYATVAAARQVLESSFAQFQADDAVVGLAARLRRCQDELQRLEADLQCSAGNAPEYFSLREELSRVQKQAQKALRAGNRSETANAVSRLRSGDAVRYREKRQPRRGVVLGSPSADWGPPTLKVVGENAKIYHVSAADLREPPVVIGHVRVPRSGVRRNRDRAAVAKQLRALQGVTSQKDAAPSTIEGNSRARQLSRLAEDLERQVREHPVHSCPDRESHAQLGHRWARTARECNQIAEQINSRTSSIAHEFDQVLEVLRHFGYLDDDFVTGRGEQLRLVFGERDLLVAECLCRNIFSELTQEELAAVACTLVYEPRGDVPLQEPSLPTTNLRQAWWKILGAYEDILREETRVRLERTKAPSAALAETTFRWANGATLTAVLEDADLPPGDFVRWMRQTIDLLEQLRRVSDPHLRKKVDGAIKKLRRGVVQWIDG